MIFIKKRVSSFPIFCHLPFIFKNNFWCGPYWNDVERQHFTTVTFQAFNGLEHGMIGTWFFVHIIFCTHTLEEEGLIVPGTERHARLFEVAIYAWGNDEFSSLERTFRSLRSLNLWISNLAKHILIYIFITYILQHLYICVINLAVHDNVVCGRW